jgi:hypothetical protein
MAHLLVTVPFAWAHLLESAGHLAHHGPLIKGVKPTAPTSPCPHRFLLRSHHPVASPHRTMPCSTSPHPRTCVALSSALPSYRGEVAPHRLLAPRSPASALLHTAWRHAHTSYRRKHLKHLVCLLLKSPGYAHLKPPRQRPPRSHCATPFLRHRLLLVVGRPKPRIDPTDPSSSIIPLRSSSVTHDLAALLTEKRHD